MKRFCFLLLIILSGAGIASAQNISISQKVDLGLSVCWAGYNLGASSPDGCGGFYEWGETHTQGNCTIENCQYENERDGIFIGDDISGTQHDVARLELGGTWRIPTRKEWRELIERCNWVRASYKGVNGFKVTGPNGNSIFLPVASNDFTTPSDDLFEGCYWSSTIDDCYSYAACTFYFSVVQDFYCQSNRRRGIFCQIRPVCDVSELDMAAVEDTTENPVTEETVEDEIIFPTVEQQPEFPGGLKALNRYLYENISYPQESRMNGSQGEVFVRFVVDVDGSIDAAEVIRSSGDILLDREAVRVVSGMPNWKPGMVSGRAVRVYYILPLSFKLYDPEPAGNGNEGH